MNETNPTRTPKTTSKTGSIQVDQTLARAMHINDEAVAVVQTIREFTANHARALTTSP